MFSRHLADTAIALQNVVIASATGKGDDSAGYSGLRYELMSYPQISDRLPRLIRICRDLSQAREYVLPAGGYQARRELVRTEMMPLLDFLEGVSAAPADVVISAVLAKFDTASVHDVWQRALERRSDDPDGAITLARTLLETVCKHVLDEAGVEYDEKAELPKLFRITADQLNLSPNQHSDLVLRQILGSCAAVVEGLGALRNRLSDAHGQGKQSYRPSARHAELAVNLAGSAATFIVSTWLHRSNRES